MNNVYSWKSAIPILKGGSHADAQQVGEAIERLGGLNIKPQKIVEAARHDAVLSPHFEWDDAVGAELHRRQQARALVSALRVERIASDGETTLVPAFISLVAPGETSPSYQPMDVIEASPDLQRVMLLAALRDLRSWMTRYSSLANVCTLLKPALKLLEAEQAKYDAAAASAAASIPDRTKARKTTGTGAGATPAP